MEFVSKVIASWSDPLFAGEGMCNMAREIVIAVHERAGYHGLSLGQHRREEGENFATFSLQSPSAQKLGQA